jgi:hypothetical protein
VHKIYLRFTNGDVNVVSVSRSVHSVDVLSKVRVFVLFPLGRLTDKRHVFEHSIERKKSFTIFPSPAGMSFTKLSLGGNNDVIY